MKPKSSNRFLFSLRSLLNSSGITLAMALSASQLHAAGGSWNTDTAGSWETAANWNPAAVPGTTAGDVVNLLFNISAARTVTIGTGVTATVGDLNIGDPGATVFAYTLAAGGTGSISLDGTGTTDATIDFTSNVINQISAPITLVDNGVIRSNVVAQHVFSGIISGTGKSLTFNNDVDGVSTAPTLTSGQFTLNAANTYTGGTNISDVRVGTNNAAGLGTGAVNITGAGQVYVSSNITLANNFTLNSTGWAETGFNFGALRLENGATVSGTITLAQNTTVGSFGGTGNLRGVISGAFSLTKTGSQTIAINNTTAANTYSGGTTISQGTLSIGTGGTGADTARVDALGTGPVTVNSTGTLQLWIRNNASFTIANNLTVNGGTIRNEDGNHTLSGSLSVGASGATIYSRYDTKNLTLSGVVSGTGAVTLDADGSTILLTNSNTYSGGTTFSRGRVSITSGNGFGTGALAITSTGNTTLTVANNAATTLANNISLPAPGAAATHNLVKNSGGATTGTQLDLTGVISGGNSNVTLLLNSSTTGDTTTTYRLAGTNTFTGKVQVFRGGVVVTNAASLGAGTNILELNSNNSALGDLRFENAITLANPVSLLSAATISSNGVSAGLSGVISGSAAFNKVGAGTLTVSGANTFTGATTVSAGTLSLNYGSSDTSKLADAATLTLREGSTLNLTSPFPTSHVEVVSATNVTGNASITRSGSSTNKIALGLINNAGGSLNLGADSIATTTTPLINGFLPGFITVNGGLATKDGSDNIIAYTGYTDVDRLGGTIPDAAGANVRIIEAGSSGNVTLTGSGTTSIGTLSNAGTAAATLVDIGSGNILRLGQFGTVQAGTNGLTITNGTLTAGGVDNTAGTIDLFNGSATPTAISSVIANNGTGVVGLAKSGPGVLSLSAANTYTGTSTVNGGTLALVGGSSIADTAAISLANTAGVTLRLDSSETIGALTSGTASTVNLQANTLTVAGTASTTASGTITGTGSLVKQGTGILTLAGVNTFSGGTTLTQGEINATINTTQNSLGTGAASVASGTTLTLNNTNTSATTPTIANTFTGTGLLKLTFAANTTARTTFLTGITGFTGTIQLSTLGSTGDKWGIAGISTSAPVIIDSGTQLFPNTTPSTLSGGITVSGTGNSEARGAIRLATTLGGNITLAGDTTIGAEGGTLTGNITSSAASPVTLTVGTTNAGAASTFNGIISNGTSTVAVTKAAGSGTMTLAGANTYSGATTISAGTLSLTGSAVNSALSMAATTSLNGEGTVASLSTTGATNLAINAATAGAFTATGAFTPGSGAVTTVSLTANNTPTSGTVRVLNYGSTTATAANFAISGTFRAATFDVQATYTDLILGVANLTWTGTGGTNWDVNTTSNWNDATPAASRFFLGDSVTFDDSPAGTAQTIALTTTVQPASITFNNSTDTYSLTGTTGAIIGTTGITKNGTANVTLAGGTGQNYTGPIAVNAGSFTTGSANALGQTSGVTVATGARVDLNGQLLGNATNTTWTIAGDGGDGAGTLGAITNTSASGIFEDSSILNLILSGNAEVGGNAGRFDIGRHGTTGAGGSINGGNFTLTKVGSNQIVVRAPATNITYEVNAGTLSFEDFDTASGTNAITVNGTGTLGSFGARTIANNVTFAAGTTLTNLGGATGTWTGTLTLSGITNVNTAGASIVIDGALAGSANLVRAGANTLFLQNSSTSFSGKIINNAGTLRVEGNTALGTATGADVLTMANGSTLQFGTVTAASSGTIGSATQGITQTLGATYDATTGNTLTIDGAITATGTLTKANNSGHVIFNRAITSTGGVSANGGTQTYNGNVSLGGPFEVGTNIVTNLNSPVFATTAMNFWTGTTNIAIGTGSITNLNVGNATGQSHIINHTAGALTSSGQAFLGHWGGQTSVYNLSGGSFNQPDTVTTPTSESQANFLIGIDGSGILNVSGTGVLNTTSLVVNGRNEGNNLGQDAVNLTGGRINLGKWGMRTSGTTYAVNLGGGIMGASADWSSALNMNLTGTGGNVTFNTLDSVNATTPRTITLSGTLSGTGGLTKSGEGVLNLTGTKSYTGPTNVNGGTLYPGTSLTTTSVLSVNSGGTLSTGSVATAGTSTIGFLSLNGGTVSLRADFTAGDLINANVFSVPAASTITITPVSNLLPGDLITLIDYNGSIGGLGFGGLTLTPLANPHYQASLVNDTVNTRVQVSLDQIDPVIWLGNVDGNWDVNTTSNWKTLSNGLPSPYYNTDVVRFTDDGAAAPAVNLVGTIQPLSVTFDATVNYTLSGAGITGATGLEKKNTGTVTLLNNNTYTGLVKVTAGTLRIGNGGTSGTLGGSGNVEVAGTLEFNRSDAQTLSRTIIGGGSVVKNGTNTLTMSAGNNVCDIVINNGTLAARGGAWATSFAANRTITVNSPGILDTTTHALGGLGGATRPNNIVINEDAIWKLNNEQQLPNTALTLNAGILNGPGDIRGGGTIATLAHATKSSTINAPVNSGNGAVAFNVADGGVAADLSVTGNLVGGNVYTKSGAGTMVISGNNTYTGGTSISGGTLEASSIADAGGIGSIGVYTTGLPGYLGIGNDATFRYSGTGTQTSARNLWLDTGTQNKTIEVTSPTADITFSGTGGNINQPFTKTGAGALTLADSINVGATVTVNGGRLTLTGTSTYTGTTTITTGTLVIDEGSIASSSSIANNGVLEYKLTTNARTYSNVISGTGSLVKSGTNTLTLAGLNTYSGNTTVNNGTLALADNAQLRFVLGATSGSSNSLTGAGTVTLDGDFVIDTTAADGLTDGTWTLENVSTLTGAYGSTFTVVGFTDAGNNKWTKVSGSKLYTFDETTGVLTLAANSAYDSWATARGLTGAPGFEAGKSNDPDGDGRNNLYEFAFDGDPLSAANDGKIVGKIATVGADQVMTLTLPVRTGASFSADGGDQLSALIDAITYRIEGDSDLGTFNNTISEVTGGDATAIQTGLPVLSTGWTYRTFRSTGTVSTVPKVFLRAKISE